MCLRSCQLRWTCVFGSSTQVVRGVSRQAAKMGMLSRCIFLKYLEDLMDTALTWALEVALSKCKMLGHVWNWLECCQLLWIRQVLRRRRLCTGCRRYCTRWKQYWRHGTSIDQGTLVLHRRLTLNITSAKRSIQQEAAKWTHKGQY